MNRDGTWPCSPDQGATFGGRKPQYFCMGLMADIDPSGHDSKRKEVRKKGIQNQREDNICTQTRVTRERHVTIRLRTYRRKYD